MPFSIELPLLGSTRSALIQLTILAAARSHSARVRSCRSLWYAASDSKISSRFPQRGTFGITVPFGGGGGGTRLPFGSFVPGFSVSGLSREGSAFGSSVDLGLSAALRSTFQAVWGRSCEGSRGISIVVPPW